MNDCFQIITRYTTEKGAGGGRSDAAVDYARLGDLSAALEDGLRDVIETYLEDSPRLITAMRAAFARQDWPELQRLAHSLKSSSGIFGAREMIAHCRSIESAALDHLPECSVTIAAAASAFQSISAELTAYLSGALGRN